MYDTHVKHVWRTAKTEVSSFSKVSHIPFGVDGLLQSSKCIDGGQTEK